jgi:hypothetical protein
MRRDLARRTKDLLIQVKHLLGLAFVILRGTRRKMTARRRLALLFPLCLLGSWSPAFSQIPDDFLRMFGEIAQTAIMQAARSEWNKLPVAELGCVNNALRRQGASIDALIHRGVMPSDSKLASIRAACRSQTGGEAQQPTENLRTLLAEAVTEVARLKAESSKASADLSKVLAEKAEAERARDDAIHAKTEAERKFDVGIARLETTNRILKRILYVTLIALLASLCAMPLIWKWKNTEANTRSISNPRVDPIQIREAAAELKSKTDAAPLRDGAPP